MPSLQVSSTGFLDRQNTLQQPGALYGIHSVNGSRRSCLRLISGEFDLQSKLVVSVCLADDILVLLKPEPVELISTTEGNFLEMLQREQECLGIQYEQSACGPDQAALGFYPETCFFPSFEGQTSDQPDVAGKDVI